MNYKDIDWPRVHDRHRRWWRGELDGPLLYMAVWPDASAGLEPRPAGPAAVRKWFMDPATRMSREIQAAKHSWYFADGFPAISIGRINIGQAAFYGCPTDFTQHTIWVEPVLETWDDWEEKIRFDPDNELWQLTLGQARKAVEVAEDDVAILTLGGAEGVLDNLATVRGTARALMDVIEEPDRVVALERRFLDDFRRTHAELHEILRVNPRGVSLWNLALMDPDRPAHCIQSDFSCMISPELYRRLGLWYVREQASMFANTIYHLDGSNALHHLPMLLALDELDAVQFIYQVPTGQPLREWTGVLKQILAAGKRAEVFAWDFDDILPVLREVPGRGLKINAFPPDRAAGEKLVAEVRGMGYLED